jgi:predicted outer membrane lipoprotein
VVGDLLAAAFAVLSVLEARRARRVWLPGP